MKWTTATLALLATGGLLLAGRVLLRPDRATPSEILASVEAARALEISDSALLLRDLNRAVKNSASDQPDPLDRDLAAALLQCRAELQAELGNYDRAAADLDLALLLDEKQEPALTALKIQYLASEGDVAGALRMALALCESHEEFYPAQALAGVLASQEAQRWVSQAMELADTDLGREESKQVKALMTSMGARTRGEDPERARQANLLREFFLPNSRTDLLQALQLLDRASGLNATARAKLCSSMAGDPGLEAITALLQLYIAAGQDELAAELGGALLAKPPASHSEDIFRLTFESLLRLEQPAGASILVKELKWDRMRPSRELCLEVGKHLFMRGEWGQLDAVAKRLDALQETKALSAAKFFQGYSYSADKKWARAAEKLVEFSTLDIADPPVPFAQPRANLQLAHVYGQLGAHKLERERLVAAIGRPALLANPGWLKEIRASEFRRLAELALAEQNAGYRNAEEYLTRALSKSPERTSEWMEEWNRVGALSLQRAGHTLDELLTSMSSQGRSLPAIDVGPWTLFKIAESHLRRSSPTAASNAARKLLKTYPHLLPVLDIQIESRLERGMQEEVLDDILLRIQLAGSDPASAGFLKRIGVDELPSAQRKRLVIEDPDGRGRLEVARHLLAIDQPSRALVALEPLSLPGLPGQEGPLLEVLPPELRILRARALGQAGRLPEASQAWLELLENSVVSPDALVHLVQAQLGSGQSEALEPLVDLLIGALAQPTQNNRAAALSVVDHLLAGGQPDLAGRLLLSLDGSVELRGGDVLERMALAAAQRGDAQGLELVLERAEAFLTQGGAELIRVLYAVENRAWPELPKLVRQLRATGYEPSEPSEAILSLLEERLEAGHEQARAGSKANPQSGTWAIILGAAQSLMDSKLVLPRPMGKNAQAEMGLFLRGVEGARRDPRAALSLLLSIEREGWGTWALPRLLEMGQTGGGVLWPTFLGARAHDSLGQEREAQDLYDLLIQDYSRFVPAWNGLEAQQVALTGSPISKAVLELRAKRARVLGSQETNTDISRAIDNASRLAANDKGTQAVRILEKAITESDGDTHWARILLARILVDTQDYGRAASEYALVLAGMPSDPGEPLLAEYVGMLRVATDESLPQDKRLNLTTVEVLIAAQSKHFPQDPLLAFEQARLGFLLDSRNPTLAAESVETLFKRFRRVTFHTPLNDLRPGSAIAWARLLTRVRPGLAQELLTSDLQAHPGDIDLWHLYADLLAVQGPLVEERALREAIVRMCPEAAAHQDLAWVLMRSAAPVALVNNHLTLADELEDGPQAAALRDRAAFIRNLASLERSRGRGIDARALSKLKKQWANRRKLRNVDLPVLGRRFALGLLKHGADQDLVHLPVVVSALQALPDCDAYTRDFATALAGMGQ